MSSIDNGVEYETLSHEFGVLHAMEQGLFDFYIPSELQETMTYDKCLAYVIHLDVEFGERHKRAYGLAFADLRT